MVPAALRVDVWSDVVCPWCYIGITRLGRALPAAEVRLRPFLLRPDLPPEGLSIPDMLRQRYRVDPEAAFARVQAEAKRSELDLDPRRQARLVPTLAAHTLLDAVLEANPPAQPVLARALFAAYFDDARDISQQGVLIEVASAHGHAEAWTRAVLTDQTRRAKVADEARAVSSQGISGVPVFVLRVGDGPGVALSGAQPEAVLQQAAAHAAAAAG